MRWKPRSARNRTTSRTTATRGTWKNRGGLRQQRPSPPHAKQARTVAVSAGGDPRVLCLLCAALATGGRIQPIALSDKRPGG